MCPMKVRDTLVHSKYQVYMDLLDPKRMRIEALLRFYFLMGKNNMGHVDLSPIIPLRYLPTCLAQLHQLVLFSVDYQMELHIGITFCRN